MMDGINLSQSMQESRKSVERGSFLDKGFIGTFVIFFLVVGIWGGLEWYIGSIAVQIAVAESDLQKNIGTLSGKKVDRIGDFSDRSLLIQKESADSTDPKSLLDELESMMVQGIVLTEYEYDRENRKVSVSGVTDSFRYLAQQVLVFKTSDAFSGVNVDSLERTKEGKIAFTLVANFSRTSK